jgi:hypothetical protein
MDLNKVKVAGPCRITLDGVDMGHTLGGILFTGSRELTKVMADKYGTTPIDYVLNGTEATLEFQLAQTDFRQLDPAMPETSSYDGAGTMDRVDIGGDAGYSMRQGAKQMVVHPLKNADTDFSEDITLYMVVSTGNVELPYRVDEQKVLSCTYTALVSEAYGVGRRLGHIGPAAVS